MIGSCPECNGKLSSDAATCPHCGHAQKPQTAPPVPTSGAAPENRIPCPFCGEQILSTANVCRFCKGQLIQGRPAPQQPTHAPSVVVPQQQVVVMTGEAEKKTSCVTWLVLILLVLIAIPCIGGLMAKP